MRALCLCPNQTMNRWPLLLRRGVQDALLLRNKVTRLVRELLVKGYSKLTTGRLGNKKWSVTMCRSPIPGTQGRLKGSELRYLGDREFCVARPRVLGEYWHFFGKYRTYIYIYIIYYTVYNILYIIVEIYIDPWAPPCIACAGRSSVGRM